MFLKSFLWKSEIIIISEFFLAYIHIFFLVSAAKDVSVGTSQNRAIGPLLDE